MPMPTGRDRAANAPAASLRGVTRQANLQALEVDKTMIMGVLDSSGPVTALQVRCGRRLPRSTALADRGVAPPDPSWARNRTTGVGVFRHAGGESGAPP